MPRGKRRIWRPHGQEWPRAPQGSFLDSLEERFLRSETSRAFHVQKFDHSQNSAIRITYRISLRSSSLPEPRYPSAGLLIFDSSKALARRPTTQIKPPSSARASPLGDALRLSPRSSLLREKNRSSKRTTRPTPGSLSPKSDRSPSLDTSEEARKKANDLPRRARSTTRDAARSLLISCR